MADEIERISGLYINGIYLTMFAKLVSTNQLSYSSTPTRDNDMNLCNGEVAHGYIPQLECTLGKITEEQYASLIQAINVPSFTAKYYDLELGRNVVRKMYCTSYSLGTLYHHGVDLKGLIGSKLTFVCYNGYADYQGLKDDKIME